MMEGETGTPAVVRLPDEETSFISRKVEAPRRRQRQQELQARRKRLALLTTATVTMLAFGAVGVLLTVPSDTSDEVKTAVSQAMASATTTKSEQVFVPSFAVYDEDGDGKVSLGEYLDRLVINYDAAREKVEMSSLNEEEKARLLDSLDEDFKKHSDCVTNIAQEHEDEMMTEENFNEIYEKITKEFCPMIDDIPDSYQATETASGKVEEMQVEDLANPKLWGSTSDSSSSENSQGSTSDSSPSDNSQGSASDSSSFAKPQGSTSDSSSSDNSQRSQSSSDESSGEPDWNPEKPTLPPRPVSAHKSRPDGVNGKNVKMWRPSYPTAPPIPDTKISGAPPSAASQEVDNTEPESSSTSASEDVDNTEPESSSTSASEDVDTTKLGIGDGQWNPTFPTSPPEPTKREREEPTEKATYRQDEKPNRAYNDYKAASADTGAYNTYTGANTDTGAYNAYTGVESNTYGKKYDSQSYPEAAAQESPFGEPNREYEKPTSAYNDYKAASADTGAYNTYTGANTDTGAYNAYTGVESNTYGKKYDSQSYPEAAAQESPFGEPNREYEKPTSAYNDYKAASADTGAYNTYTGANTDTGAYNAYTGVESNTYGKKYDSQSYPEAAAQESPFGEPNREYEKPTSAYNDYKAASADTGAYNTYTGANTDTGAYNAYTGVESNTYGKKYDSQSYPEAAAQESPFGEPNREYEKPTSAYNDYKAASADTGAYNTYTGANTDTGAYNAYTGVESNTYGKKYDSQSYPEAAAQESPFGEPNREYEKPTSAYNDYKAASADTGAYNTYTGANTDTGAYNAYTGVESNTYGKKYDSQSYPEAAAQESPFGEPNREYEKPTSAYNDYKAASADTGAYNTYTGANTDTGAYNAYTGVESNTYGKKYDSQSYPEAAAQESPFGEPNREYEKPTSAYNDYKAASADTGAYNTYTGANTDTGAYNAYTGVESNTYGKKYDSQSYPEAAAQESPFGEPNREYEKPTSAYNDYKAASADTGAYNTYTGANTDTGAYNAYTGVESNTYGKKYDSQSYPEAAAQESPFGEPNREYEKPTSAYNDYKAASADTGAYNTYTGANTDTGAYNAYTGVESNTYGKKYDSQSYPEAAAQESPFGEPNREYEKPTSAYNDYKAASADTGAYNTYTGANTDTGAYNAYTGVESNTYGKKYDSQSYQERGAGAWKTGEESDFRGEGSFTLGGASKGATYNAENSWKQLRGATP